MASSASARAAKTFGEASSGSSPRMKKDVAHSFGNSTMAYNPSRYFRSLYMMFLSRTFLVLAFLFVFYQGYSNCRLQDNLCEMTKESLELIRLSLSTYSTSRGIIEDIPIPLSAKACNLEAEYSSLLEQMAKKAAEEPKAAIYAITPTFTRPVQKAELTRLSQTFKHVPHFHWIVVEDSQKKTPLVSNFLAASGLSYTHLNAATPSNFKLGKNDPNWKKARGVEQRNAALRWIRANLNETHNGIVFFADDDNTYALPLFRELSKVKRVGVWPVGLVGGLMVERPLCDNITNKVVGFNSVWKPERPFPIDMAGFGIHVKVILEKKDAWFGYKVQSGYQESEILRQLTTRNELEPLGDMCTKVYVWHTRTQAPVLNTEQILIKKGKRSNEGIEV